MHKQWIDISDLYDARLSVRLGVLTICDNPEGHARLRRGFDDSRNAALSGARRRSAVLGRDYTDRAGRMRKLILAFIALVTVAMLGLRPVAAHSAAPAEIVAVGRQSFL